jgi:hypothetical protein
MDRQLIINLEEITSERDLVYVGDRVRPSTATSIVLLSPNILACCHFNGCRIFLIEFDITKSAYKLIYETETLYNGKKTETDLMHTDLKGNIVVSNFYEKTCSLYKYDNKQINFFKDLKTKIGDFVHGVKFYNTDTVAVTSRKSQGGVHFIDCIEDKVIFKLLANGLSVQDICFLSPNILAMISSTGSPTMKKIPIYHSMLHIIEFNMAKKTSKILQERFFENSHFDNIVEYEDVLYFTDQYNNKVISCYSKNIKLSHDILGFNFPHGIDVKFDVMAVTNYGNNTIELRSV